MKLVSFIFIISAELCFQRKDEFAAAPTCTCSEAALGHLLLSATDIFRSGSQIKVICQSTVRVG